MEDRVNEKTHRLYGGAMGGGKSFTERLRVLADQPSVVTDPKSHGLRMPPMPSSPLEVAVANLRLDKYRDTFDTHLQDAVAYGQGAAAKPYKTPLGEYSDADLIMHMMNRGYACMKLPEGGGVPNVLKEPGQA